jgi:kynurenine 3-monooxygenase
VSDDGVAVIGAGLAGCLLALFLAGRGHRVRLYERRGDPRAGEPERGRSINLALSERGLDALRRVRATGPADGTLADRVLADALPMRGRMIHPVLGPLDFQPYSADRTRAINSIGRAELNNALLAETTAAGVEVCFDHTLVGLDAATGAMRFETSGGEVGATAAVVLGADGAGSAVRGQLLARDLLTESLDILSHGYKELTIPPVGGEFALDPGALHIWPRGQAMMIALPNPDRSFTCTLFWPTGGTGSFASLSSPAAIARHFETWYPDVPPLAPHLVEEYQQHPVGLLGTVRCAPWHAYGRVGLVGDAAHAIVPFYGQGANCAFEDVVELDRCLDATGGAWERALPLFEARRRDNTEAIAWMALDNFVEMRDRVASPVHRTRTRVEHALERALPGRYVSRYELVSFTTVPYARVLRRVRRQRQALAVLAGGLVAAVAAATLAGRRRP